jgi:hypothetical protein
MAQAFSQSSAVAGLANQSIDDLSAALAILANNGVKGSDAGTSVKTMLMRLMAPADDAASALAQVGLSTQSFRGADGKMRPMVEIIRILNGAMGDLDQTAKDDLFRRIFGADAIRAASILSTTGADGFKAIQDAMASALPVSEKFKTIMSGLYGAGLQVLSALERLSIAISDAVAPALAAVVPFITGLIDGITNLARANPAAVAGFAKLAVAAVGVGGALTGLGVSFQVASFGFAGIGKAAMLALSPLTLVASAAGGVGKSFALAMPETIKLVKAVGASLVGAATSAIAYGSSLATMAAATAARLGFVAATWTATGIAISAGFLAHIKAMVTYYTGALAGVQAITISRAGATAAAWISSAVGADTFANAMKAAMTTSNRVVNSTVAAITPAISFVAKGMSAVASDVARLVAPLTRPFVAVGQSVGAFASTVAGHVASYITSVASAAAATVTGTARIASAWASQAAGAVGRFVTAATAPIAAYLASIATAVAGTAAAAASIVGSWISTAMPATAAFAAGAARSIGTYIASTVAAAAASVANAARSGLAWIAAGLPGLTGFAAGAVRAIGTYLASAAMAVAGSVASAAAVAAAWLAPLAPVALIVAAVAGAGAAVYAFRDKLSGVFSGIGGYVSQAAGAISDTFGPAIADAGVVFGDLYSTATTTFSGIYDAIAAGDLSGAMDVLWAGLLAGWLRGTEAIMSYVDPWIATFQNAFTILGAEIYKTWDGLWVSVGNAFNIAGAYLQGAMDNIINPILASWDVLEAGIRKAWIRVSGIFKDGDKKKAELDAVDAEMRGRAEKRAKDRPGVTGRVAQAQQENAAANADLATRNAAVDANTQATMDARNAATDQAAADRRAATVAAEQRLGDVTRGQSEDRAMKSQADDLLAAIRGATSVDQLAGEGGLGEKFQKLRDLGRLTSVQETAISEALDKAAEGLTNVATGEAKAGAVDPAANVGTPDTRSKADVVGTFSSMNLGGLGYGGSLAERTAKAAEETAKGVKELVKKDGDKVAA